MMVFAQGRMLVRSNQTSSLAPLLASTVVKFAACGLSNCGLPLSDGVSPEIFTIPVAARPHVPAVCARVIVAALIVVLPTWLAAAAEDWPARPVHFIVSFPAGGSTDVAARVVAEHLTRTFGQQVVVENKSGANGNLGIEAVAKSAPDGYSILISTDSVS